MAAWISESETYVIAGRLLFPAYLAAMAGVYCPKSLFGRETSPWVRGSLWFTLAALAVGLVGDLGSYYGGAGDGVNASFSAAQSIFYGAVEFPAITAAQVGVTVYGLALWRTGEAAPARALGVAAVGPLGFLLWPLHIPSGPLLMFSLLAIIGTPARPRDAGGIGPVEDGP